MGNSNTGNRLTAFRESLGGFGKKIGNDWTSPLAGMIAYNLLLSLLPLIMCLFCLISLIFDGDIGMQEMIRDRLISAFPRQGIADIVNNLFDSLRNQAGVIFAVSFIVALFGGSRLLVAVDDALTVVFRLRERSFIHQKLHAFKTLVVFFILMPALLITASAPALFTNTERWYWVGTTLSNVLFGFLLIELTFYYVPNRKMEWRNTWCGALLTTFGIKIALVVFPIYANLFMTSYVGQLGVVLVMVLFFYIVGFILLFGAQVNAYYFDNIQPLPVGIASFVQQSIEPENTTLLTGLSTGDNTITSFKDGFDPDY